MSSDVIRLSKRYETRPFTVQNKLPNRQSDSIQAQVPHVSRLADALFLRHEMKKMTGIQRIAYVLAELSPADRASLLARLPVADRVRLSAVHRTRAESSRKIPSSSPRAKRSLDAKMVVQQFIDATREVSTRPKAATDLMSQIGQFDPTHIAETLKEELPQTIASVLQGLPASIAADVLVRLPLEDRVPVIQCIVESTPIAPELVHDLAVEIISALSDSCTPTGSPANSPGNRMGSGGLAHLQAMIAESPPEVQIQLSASVERADTGAAPQLVRNRSA